MALRTTMIRWCSLLPIAATTACIVGGDGAPPPPASPTNPPSTATAPGATSTAPATAPTAAAPSGYDKPPSAILDVMNAPMPPSPVVSPTDDKVLLDTEEWYPPMTSVAAPYLRLAGVRVEPANRRKHDTPGGYGVAPCARGYAIVDVASGTTTEVKLPAGGCADSPEWSADGKHFAFRNATDTAVEMWIVDASTGAARKVDGVRLNPMLGRTTMQWMPDQKSLLVKLVPDGQGDPPAAPIVPQGPSIEETHGEKGQSSTYELRDTLTSKHDEDLFDYYASAQMALVDASSGAVTKIGAPAIYGEMMPSPDDNNILVQTIHKPYSYVTTFENFPNDYVIWDRTGKQTHEVAKIPLADRIPIHGVREGARDFEWRANEPATLVWAEALDKGDWNVKVPARDKVMMQRAPFSAAPVEVTRVEQRYDGFHWGEKTDTALMREWDENRHWNRTFVVNVDQPSQKPRLLWDLSSDEHYKNPGNPMHRTLPNGFEVMRQDGTNVFLAGVGSSPDGDRPFVDELDLAKTGAAPTRLFRSDKTSYEAPLAFADAASKKLLTWRQSPTDAPNAFVRTLGAAVANAPAGEPTVASTSQAVTHLADPTPEVRKIKKRLVKYKRKDGMELSFTLYTPPGYQEGTRVPAILNAYPLDFAGKAQAGQVTGSENKFTRLYQYQLLLLAGYAVIDRASFPIVGDPKKAYDTYLEQLVDDAKAAVDKAVEIGVVDRDRIGVTGHSHGALMTVNLLAHSDLFRAGAATSGSYNKTLTPFGFQNERRSVWEAENVYLKVSPFFYADKMKLPLLLVHGDDDANPGTTPLQARKLYEAVRGNGGVARLVMLPHEPHWYAARESNEQLVYEEVTWFDKFVKNAGPRATAAAPAPAKKVK